MESIQKRIQKLSLKERRALAEELLRRKSKLDKVYQMSYGQKALWLIHERSPGNTAYNIAFAVRFNSEISIELLQNALQILVDRHDALRTVYPRREDGNPVQVVKVCQKLHFEDIDVSSADENKVKEITAQFNRKPFDLEEGPIMRSALFRHKTDDSILVFSIHQIACDFSSLIVLQQELFMLYYGLKAGKTDILNMPSHQYDDFCKWQDTLINSQTGEEMLDYWKKQLEGDIPFLEIATDKLRSPVQTFNGAAWSFEVNSVLSYKLKRLAMSEGVTLFTLFLSAFQVLLHKYTSQNENIVGIPLSGRNPKGFESIVGHMKNMAPVHAEFSPHQAFDQFLLQISDNVSGAVKHGEYPFPLLVEKLQPHRDPGRSPVFQVTFEMLKHQQMWSEKLSEDLKISPYEVPQQDGQFDIMLKLNEVSDNFVGVFMYNTDLFEAGTIKRLSENYLALLNGIADDPKLKISELSILSKRDRKKLLEEWNDTGSHIEQDLFVHRLFEEQVKADPKALAVCAYDGRMTYEELNRKSNQLANYLHTLGMEKGKRIGICMKPSKYMVVALLGVLKLGAAYVAIAPDYPEKRIEYILDDADVSIILSVSSIEALQNRMKTARLDIDTCDYVLSDQSSRDPDVSVSPRDIAYILYTSGSTGKPKGIKVYHIGMVNYLQWCAQKYIGPDDDTDMPASFAYLPLAFDASITSLYTPLITGRYLLIPRKQGSEVFDDPEVQKGGFSFVKLTPAHLNLLGERLGKERLCRFTKRVIVGGEALLSEQLAYFRECDLDWIVMNEYGPAETVVGSTVYSFSVKERVPQNVPIGKPIVNTNIFIIDSQNQLVPIGVIGEIAIGGTGVSEGYVNSEDLTREKYIVNSFIKGENKYLYKTGDLGRWLPDGNLEYIGRSDHQVKVKGHRVELEEVETVLAGSPGVSDAVVVVREMEAGDRQLVAYYVSDKKQTGTVQEIKNYLGKWLPYYMMPAVFIELDDIPLTNNGKADRLMLSARAARRMDGICRDDEISTLEDDMCMNYTSESDIKSAINCVDSENSMPDPKKCKHNLYTYSEIRRCTKCTLPETFPNIEFDDEGVCNYCDRHNKAVIKETRYKFETEDELIERLQKYKRYGSRYDVLMPLSGGVDSSVALIRIVEKYGLKVLAFHNDHGYEDDTATENVKKLCKAMNVDLIIKQQDLAFMKKLWKYTHETKSRGLSACYVCGEIIHANSLEIADRYNIPMVISGYSNGQVDMMADKGNLLEAWNGLLEEYKKDPDFLRDFMEKQKHIKKQITIRDSQDFISELPEGKMLVMPFYLFDFYKTDKDKLVDVCIERFDWKPAKCTYPNRTTNCTMVWLNTYVDICKLGYTMYDEEYAGIIRAGDMPRTQAISDLTFSPPEGLIERLAQEVGTDLSNVDH